MIGETILHYNIIEKIGEGGMGVVYKAEDTKLKRIVALKFLPGQISSDKTAKERFLVEAQAAAALNHPNIATIYSIEESEEGMFIVMEYVDGQTLKRKIETDPFTISEAFTFAGQVADGLHTAHKNGVVHRDIKTPNLMVTQDGTAKIMDFGLAKLAEGSLLTKDGTTLGTAAYMSPEQARGDKVDHKTDIWSLGVVFYEMIAGIRPFKGEYETALVYSILNVDPEPLTGLRTGVPMRLEEIINKLLAKDPDERYQNVIELPVDLKNVNLKDVGTSQIDSSVIKQTDSTQKELNVKIKYSSNTIRAVVAAIVITFSLTWFLKPETEPEIRKKRQFSIPVTQTTLDTETGYNHIAISLDGQKIVFMGGSPSNLYLRDLEKNDTVLVKGTEGARNPFFSPDFRWIGYQKLRSVEFGKVTVDGGTPSNIKGVDKIEGLSLWPNYGAVWSSDDNIIFGEKYSLYKLSADSGIPEFLISFEDLKKEPRFPHFLPDGKRVLFSLHSLDDRLKEARIALYSFETGKHEILLNEESYNPVYSYSGHILYGRSGVLMAVAFDEKSGKITGDPAPVLDNVRSNSTFGGMSFAIACDGTAWDHTNLV